MQCQEGTVCHEQNGTGCLGRQGERESLKFFSDFGTHLDKTKRHQHLYRYNTSVLLKYTSVYLVHENTYILFFIHPHYRSLDRQQ